MGKDVLDLWALENEPIDGDINHYSFTITGDGGVGKSTFANALFSRLGRSVTFGCEDRFKGINNLKLVPINRWEDMQNYRNQLRKGVKAKGTLPFDHIVIDPVGQAGDFCEKYVCDENGWDDIGQPAYGAGYAAFENEFVEVINDLRKVGVKVDFVSHGKSEKITPPRQEGFDVQMPDVQKRLKYLVKDEVDFLLYLTVIRTKDENDNIVPMRRLYLQNYPEFSLKVPLQGFPDYIEWAGEVEEGVDLFLNAFNKAVEYTRSKQSGSLPSTPTKDVIAQEADSEVSEDTEEPSLEDLQAKAIEKRDALLLEMSKSDVIALLKKNFGVAKIGEVTDKKALMEFINA